MPRLQYDRIDLSLEIRARSPWTATSANRDGIVSIRPDFGTSGFDAETVSALRHALDQVKEGWKESSRGASNPLMRITLRVPEPQLAALEWEEACRQALGEVDFDFAVIRETPVRARDTDRPWTLPLRFLFVSEAADTGITDLAHNVFGSLPREDVDEAVQVADVSLRELGRWRPFKSWPTAEILHLDTLPALADSDLLSTTTPEVVGMVGWLSRFTEVAQTRLVVIRCRQPSELHAIRMAAQALVERGGPAVFAALAPQLQTSADFQYFYNELLHDRPLDWIARSFQQANKTASLFAGGGQEDALRVSGPALGLLELADSLQHPSTAGAAEDALNDVIAEAEGAMYFDAPIRGARARLQDLTNSIRYVRAEWPSYQFEEHETAGLIPSSRRLREARIKAFGSSHPLRRRHPPWRTPVRPPGRFVTSSLWTDGPALARISHWGARLVRDRRYHLGIQVGGWDEDAMTLGAAAILEESFDWEGEGVWVEVGVTGIDFEVQGDPVQEFWLPRQGDSERIRFAVVPRREGVSTLRFCLYHRQNVVQSFRVVAVTVIEEEEKAAPDRAIRLAAALGVEPEMVGDAGWLAHLEYSRVVDQGEIARCGDRALSVVANDSNGRPVITLKSSGEFDVELPGSLGPRVRSVRQQLEEIAEPPIPGLPRDQWRYAFGHVAEAGSRFHIEFLSVEIAGGA